jgi:23S rRNA U2552 (ribose-2'-O)-methylase RlmE/FtsJ
VVSQGNYAKQFNGIDLSECLEILEKDNLTPEANLLYSNLRLLQKSGFLGELYGVGLDVGAAWGRYIPVLQSLGVEEVYAIDLDLKNREKAISKGFIDKDHYALADASHLASIFGENAFDVVAAFMASINMNYFWNYQYLHPDELKKMFEPPNERFKQGWAEYVKKHPYIPKMGGIDQKHPLPIVFDLTKNKLYPQIPEGWLRKEHFLEWNEIIPKAMTDVLKPDGTILASLLNLDDVNVFVDSLSKYGVKGAYAKVRKPFFGVGEFIYVGRKI